MIVIAKRSLSHSRKLSIIIKAFNEQEKIEAAIRSALASCEALDTEVIVADCLSTDRTVEIASNYPVKIVQLLDSKDRSCGITPQLGFQFSYGEYIYLMDGDMELDSEFLLAGLAYLEAEPELAGVGGLVAEEHLVNLEFQSRIRNLPIHLKPGEADRLNGGGLYRRSALEQVGYLSDRNLHSFEELELALRLQAKGWRLLRLPQVAVRHYGHTISAFRLLVLRVRSRYAQGAGELLRAALGKPYLFKVIKELRVFLAVIAWWLVLVLAFGMLPWSVVPFAMTIALLPLAAIAMMLRKRSVKLGLYALISWNVFAAGTVLGCLRKRCDPKTYISSKILQDDTAQGHTKITLGGSSAP